MKIPLDSAVAALREQAGLSVIELAERLGVRREAITKAQDRGTGVTVTYLLGVAEACGLELELRAKAKAAKR